MHSWATLFPCPRVEGYAGRDDSSQGLCPAYSLVDRCIGVPWAVDFVRQVRFGNMVMADRSLFLFVPMYDVIFLSDARTDEFLIAGICTGKGRCTYGNVSAGVVKQSCVHCRFIVRCSMEHVIFVCGEGP
jgi:hypothetical protein